MASDYDKKKFIFVNAIGIFLWNKGINKGWQRWKFFSAKKG